MTRYLAPAKLNLFLHVNGRRMDGYHLLQSVFRFLDYGDELEITVRADGRIQRLNPVDGLPPEEDLCVRAARLLQQHTGCTAGADIFLHKRLPMGGGLGGGSSDAATVLLVLNRLWQCGLSRDALQALGLALGADVPVFIFGQSAFAEGVGEKLRPVSLQPGWYVVLKPDVQVPTREIFCAEELTRDTKLIRIVDFSEGACHNDLEPVARLKYPEVDACVRWLSRFGDARMTGSGACVFARFDSEEEARLALHESVGKFDGFVAKGLDKHPLYSFAEV